MKTALLPHFGSPDEFRITDIFVSEEQAVVYSDVSFVNSADTLLYLDTFRRLIRLNDVPELSVSINVFGDTPGNA